MNMNMYRWVQGVESGARTYASSFERVFDRGSGSHVYDTTGQRYLDCLCCAGALPLGHNDPEVKEAVLGFLGSGHVQQALDLTTPAKFEFLRQLYELLPPELARTAKVQFCSPSGSDAVEAAIKLVRYATKRQTIVAFHGAYHGMTGGALGAMGNLVPKSVLGGHSGGVHFAPFPYAYRCPFGSDGLQTDELSINYLRTILTDPESGIPKPAALLLEVVQGEGGCIPASSEWLRAVRQITLEQGIPLIIDEVQTGFGRTGTMFAFEHAGILPDVVILSKALGGGYPMSVVLYNETLDLWPRGMHAGTFRGNQIAMVAGAKTMSIVARDLLPAKAATTGDALKSGFASLQARFPVLGDVRGRGLMLGVEVIKPNHADSRGTPDGPMAARIKRAAFDNGLLIETGGRHGAVLRVLPSLKLSMAEVDELLSKFEAAVRFACSQ